MYMTQQNLLGLEFFITHVPPVFCTQILYLPLIIRHNLVNNNKIDHFSIEIAFHNSHNPLLDIIDITDHEKIQVQLNHQTTQRGYVQLLPLTISSRYPLGLFRAWANIQLTNDGIIYPHAIENTHYHAQSSTNSDGLGIQGRGFDDFSGFKTYQLGESIKHIHWKAYAREQGLLSKVFSGSNPQEYWLNWHDLSGHIDTRLGELCYLIIMANHQDDRYGLILPGTTIEINQGKQHQHQCLKALALYQL
jgi:uncharacterized protein (DUF58 family)